MEITFHLHSIPHKILLGLHDEGEESEHVGIAIETQIPLVFHGEKVEIEHAWFMEVPWYEPNIWILKSFILKLYWWTHSSSPIETDIKTCLPFWQEYKISSFEQRLMNEIEFRLERTPVDESDDEIQHDEIPTGKCIAPIFDKRLKHFRVTEGSPVTFTCKIVGIPVPKVGEDEQPVSQPTV